MKGKGSIVIGKRGGAGLSWDDRLVKAILTHGGPGLNMSRIVPALSTGLTFHTLVFSEFLWRKSASSAPAHPFSGSVSSLCVVEIQLQRKRT